MDIELHRSFEDSSEWFDRMHLGAVIPCYVIEFKVIMSMDRFLVFPLVCESWRLVIGDSVIAIPKYHVLFQCVIISV